MSYHVSPLDACAMAIFMFEGARSAHPDVRCIRNNNPGNLRPYLPSQEHDDDNYRVFPSFSAGWTSLEQDIAFKLQHHLAPIQTLLDFLNLYAPAGDNNNPTEYAQFVCAWMTSALGKAITTATAIRDIFEIPGVSTQ